MKYRATECYSLEMKFADRKYNKRSNEIELFRLDDQIYNTELGDFSNFQC